MKARWTGLLAALLVAGWGAAARADDASAQKELQAACDKLVQALKNKDAKTVISFYAPDYMGKRLDGTTVTREQQEAQIKRQLAAIKSIQRLSLKIDKVTVN